MLVKWFEALNAKFESKSVQSSTTLPECQTKQVPIRSWQLPPWRTGGDTITLSYSSCCEVRLIVMVGQVSWECGVAAQDWRSPAWCDLSRRQ